MTFDMNKSVGLCQSSSFSSKKEKKLIKKKKVKSVDVCDKTMLSLVLISHGYSQVSALRLVGHLSSLIQRALVE